MTARNMRKRNNTLLAKNFAKRLAAGVILDRSTPGKHKKPVIEAPVALKRRTYDEAL